MTSLSKAEKARRATAAAAKAPAAPPASGDNITRSKVAAPAVREAKGAGGVGKTTRTVVVVSKMPRGLYLQLTQFITQDQRVMGGGVEKRQVPMRTGPQVRIKPSVQPFGMIPNYPIVNGFSLTSGVDADFWRQYAEQNKNLELITSGLLRAFDNEADATAYCREYGALKHGLEPLAQDGDPRVEKSTSENLTDIEIDTGLDVPARKRA